MIVSFLIVILTCISVHVLSHPADATVGFTRSSYNISEGNLTVSITVALFGRIDRNATVMFSTQDETAIGEFD